MGLSTSRVSAVAPAVLLLVLPFIATTVSRAPLASVFAGTTADICVLLTYVEATLVPPTCNCVVDSNPVPVTVNVWSALPA